MNQNSIYDVRLASCIIVDRAIREVTCKLEEQNALKKLRKITNKDIKNKLLSNFEPEAIYRKYNHYINIYSRPFMNIYCTKKLDII